MFAEPDNATSNPHRRGSRVPPGFVRAVHHQARPPYRPNHGDFTDLSMLRLVACHYQHVSYLSFTLTTRQEDK
ncbi:MAG: hypothetical protein P8Z75_03700 [Gammaproteobacteria bacterium]